MSTRSTRAGHTHSLQWFCPACTRALSSAELLHALRSLLPRLLTTSTSKQSSEEVALPGIQQLLEWTKIIQARRRGDLPPNDGPGGCDICVEEAGPQHPPQGSPALQ